MFPRLISHSFCFPFALCSPAFLLSFACKKSMLCFIAAYISRSGDCAAVFSTCCVVTGVLSQTVVVSGYLVQHHTVVLCTSTRLY